MSKSEVWPKTRTVNPVPPVGTDDWVIWAAWADRITFEEIREVSGLDEAAVITLMRRTLKRSSFRRWRARATTKSIKHRRRFQVQREALKAWTPQGPWAEED
ncbi:MAG: TIGR03643 family protein [Myxococcota bacterium]|nr:TIGR03643 family protein [Myxococcota bacterium]